MCIAQSDIKGRLGSERTSLRRVRISELAGFIARTVNKY